MSDSRSITDEAVEAAPHGPDEPCTCDGCWACKGREMSCTCDIDWDALHESRMGT